MLSFLVKTKIMLGDSLGQALGNFRRVMIITDSFMAESGMVTYVVRRLNNGADYLVFSNVSTDPDTVTVTDGIRCLVEYNPDAVVAFGGGSAIDAAKAAVYFAQKIHDMGKCPFIAVPTTSGTGSEVSCYAVITDREKQTKHPIVDEEIIPDIAVLDAQLVKSVPPSVTADTGLDVFTHAIESYVSITASDFSKAMSRKAIKLVAKHLLTAYNEPENMQARQGMHNASCLAGIAFSNAGLGLTHSMAHALGARFHLSHGRANAILLPYVMSYNAGCSDSLTDVAKEYAAISRAIGMESSNVRQSALNLIRTIRRYSGKMGIPASIKAADISREEFDKALETMAEASMSDLCTATNPKDCTVEDVVLVFTKAFDGKLP